MLNEKKNVEREKERAERKVSIDRFEASLERSFKKLNKTMSDYGLASGKEAEFSFKLAIQRQKLICGGSLLYEGDRLPI